MATQSGIHHHYPAHRIAAVRPFLLALAFLLCGLLGYLGTDAILARRQERILLSPAQAPIHPAPTGRVVPDDLLDINQAAAADFASLPGIGAVSAQAIVDYREKIGGFIFPEGIMDVPGIGPKRFRAIRDLIACPAQE